MNLLKEFKQYIQKENLFQARDRLLLAVSGGVDSVVLCELCKKSGYDFEIAHCNFQLRGDDSNRDEKFVKELAQKYNVPFHVRVFDTVAYANNVKKSIEEAARHLRYDWFNSIINNPQLHKAHDDGTGPAIVSHQLPAPMYILTAHHADDNIETVMMNFFRGTGITGLRGILPKHGKVLRPLLFARRSQLEIFVQENNLEFVTDHTNFQNDYTRNYFRNTILPLVSERFPEAGMNVLKNIQRFKEAEILYGQSVNLHRKKLLEHKGSEIHIPVLKLAKTVPLPTVIFEIIKEFGFTAHQTDEVIDLLKSDTGKYVQSATHRIIKNRNWLIISPNQTIEAANILIEENDGNVVFSGGTVTITKILKARFSISNDPMVAQLDLALMKFPLLLRKWKQGDYFYPLGMQKKKKVSRFFIDQKLSLTQKENTWIIEIDKKIIWVVGMRIDDRFKVTPATETILKIGYISK